MPLVWLGKVDALDKVLPNVQFDIKWREWFMVWPFKEYKITSKIIKLSNGDVVDCSYTLKHWWFWGSKIHISTEWNGISKKESYKIEVGYND